MGSLFAIGTSPSRLGDQAAWTTWKNLLYVLSGPEATDAGTCVHAGQTAVRAPGTTVSRPPYTRTATLTIPRLPYFMGAGGAAAAAPGRTAVAWHRRGGPGVPAEGGSRYPGRRTANN